MRRGTFVKWVTVTGMRVKENKTVKFNLINIFPQLKVNAIQLKLTLNEYSYYRYFKLSH